MKWIGQHIYDLISRFRNDVYLEDISDGTAVDSKFLGLDSSGKVIKETVSVSVTDLHDAGVDGSANQLLTDDGDGSITSEANLTFDGSTLSIEADANTTANALFIDMNKPTTGSAIYIDVEDTYTIATSKAIQSTSYNKSADTPDTITNTVIGSIVGLNDAASSNHAGSTHGRTGYLSNIGFVNNNGTQNINGFNSAINLNTAGPTGAHPGGVQSFYSQITNGGGVDFKAVSSANTADQFTIDTTTNGATTLSTIDADAALAHFEIAADGNITLDPAGVIELEGNTTVTGDFTVNGDNITFESANADDPIVTIKNTSNDANEMASLNFVKDRDGGTAAIGDNLGEIYFSGEDASGNTQEYGRILSEIDVATHGQESGRLKFGVANHDGGNGYGLTLTGGSANDEVDVTVGLGTASTTTVAGNLAVLGSRINTTDVVASGKVYADTLELNALDDTTIARAAAGVVTIQGDQIITSKPTTVGSGQHGQLGMQIARRTITQAEMNDLHNTPIAIVPALGANLVAIPVNGTIFVDRAANQTNSAQLVIGYGSSTFANSIYFFKRFHHNISTDFHYGLDMYIGNFGTSMTAGVNTAINASADTAYTNNAFTSIDVYINYYVIDRS